MRPRKIIDLTGMKFNSFTVISRADDRFCNRSNGQKYKLTAWNVRCACGNEKVYLASHLINHGETTKCKCQNITNREAVNMITATYSLHPTTEQFIDKLAKELEKPKSWVIRRAIYLLQRQYAGQTRRANGV